MTRGNLNYLALLRGAGAADFLRMRDVDALGPDPLGAFARSVRACAAGFAVSDALETQLDETLDSALVSWITENFAQIYAGLAETPSDPATTHRFFAPPTLTVGEDTQALLLHRMGRNPDR